MFLIRGLIKQIMVVTAVGFLVRKLMASGDSRAQRVGRTANRVMGNVFGVDAEGQRTRPRGRGLVRSAAGAAFGGAMSYFFDPVQGRDRRERVRTSTVGRIRRNGSADTPLLPAGGEDEASGTPVPSNTRST